MDFICKRKREAFNICNSRRKKSMTYKCSCCGSERLLKSRYGCNGFRTPSQVYIQVSNLLPVGLFEFLTSPPPKKLIEVKEARVCADCGNIMPYIDVNELREE